MIPAPEKMGRLITDWSIKAIMEYIRASGFNFYFGSSRPAARSANAGGILQNK